MRKLLSSLAALTLVAALAQESGEGRIIRIESQGASISGNLRYGPHEYTHPEPEGLVATVSNLTILASNARLQVPAEEQGEVLLAQAEGRREATFEGGVRVQRGRLEATGPALGYSEATGLGLLNGGAEIDIAPAEEGDDPVAITTDEVEFDVDTDRSISRGNVQLTSGNQRASADELLYEEERSLGCLTSDNAQVTLTRTDAEGDELVITADQTCVLTEEERLYARGNVTVVDGSITSTGDEVFFDDEKGLAEVIGSPALSVDEANGVRLSSDRILQDIEFDYVEAIDAATSSDFSPEAFLPSESAP
ncbi:MAG: LptA/OstA family protein [Trueperaceae bacterium]